MSFTVLLLPWLTVLLAALAAGLLVKPHPGMARGAPAWLIQAGLSGLVLGALVVVTQRPWFAAALVVAMQLLLVLVNNAKYKALREPFIFTDFGLFSQALKHPRLFLPFLGVLPTLGALAAFAAALYLGMVLEPSLLTRLGSSGFGLLVVAQLALAGLTLAIGTRYAGPPTLEPQQDLDRVGLLPSLWLYRLAERRQDPRHPAHPARRAAGLDIAASDTLPHIVAVQSESFFDARRLYPEIAPDLLRQFDALRARAAAHGQLEVPAWGANTMRTEFAFLSGLADEHLGVHRFNPYRRFARHPWRTLASQLREAGYRTVCIHPHPAGFFGRDRVFPLLGFDTFIDVRAFVGAEKSGPYVSDAAVTAKIREVLGQADRPTFLFAITMENHGPLHLERVSAADIAQLYRSRPPAGFDDLTVYLRHLRNADRMLGELVDTLDAMDDNPLLCFYGDHVPSMPQVYEARGFEDGRSDYLIWRRGVPAGPAQTLRADQLGRRLLEVAGLAAAGPGP